MRNGHKLFQQILSYDIEWFNLDQNPNYNLVIQNYNVVFLNFFAITKQEDQNCFIE